MKFEIGKILLELRLRSRDIATGKPFSQAKAAERARSLGATYDRSRISLWEQDKAVPEIDNLWLHLRSLDLDFSDFQAVIDLLLGPPSSANEETLEEWLADQEPVGQRRAD